MNPSNENEDCERGQIASTTLEKMRDGDCLLDDHRTVASQTSEEIATKLRSHSQQSTNTLKKSNQWFYLSIANKIIIIIGCSLAVITVYNGIDKLNENQLKFESIVDEIQYNPSIYTNRYQIDNDTRDNAQIANVLAPTIYLSAYGTFIEAIVYCGYFYRNRLIHPPIWTKAVHSFMVVHQVILAVSYAIIINSYLDCIQGEKGEIRNAMNKLDNHTYINDLFGCDINKRGGGVYENCQSVQSYKSIATIDMWTQLVPIIVIIARIGVVFIFEKIRKCFCQTNSE